MNKAISTVILSLLFGLGNVNQGQENPAKSSENGHTSTRYARFLNRSGAFMLSKAYFIGQQSHSFDVLALTAWEVGSSEKIYAARFAGLIIDFGEVEELQQDLDKIIQAVEKSLDLQDTTSMQYKTLNGLEFASSLSADSRNPQRFVRLMLRGTMLASGPMSSVLELRTLVTQVREKLIALGAK